MHFEDTLRLGFGHSLIESNIANQMAGDREFTKKLTDKLEKQGLDVMSFGLFDASAPNFVTYYPEVKAEDLVPKDADFIQPVFRALSEVIVHKEYNPVDFGMGAVLKNSMPLLVGQTLYANHEAMVGNELGVIPSAAWQDSYSTNGIKIPSGINAVCKIDGKSNPKLARSIMMTPPSVHSTSVTVRFFWDKSHPTLSENDFFSKLGQLDKDGKMIRRIATKIKNYSEMSFVTHGADAFAQKVGSDGKIVNPKYANIVYNGDEAKTRKAQKYFFFDYKTDMINNSAEEITIPEEINNNLNDQPMKEALIFLALQMGLVQKDLPEDDTALSDLVKSTAEAFAAKLVAETKKVTDTQTSLEAAQAQVTQLTSEVDTLKKVNAPEELTKLQDFQKSTLTAMRNTTKALYSKLKGDKAVPAMQTTLENSDYNTLLALKETWEAELEEKFPAKCSSCGSNKITRASSVENKEDDSKDENGKKSLSEIRQARLKKQMAGSSFFGTAE